MEYLDVLDENGVRIGQYMEREKVHMGGEWHRITLVVVINNANQILLQQRSDRVKKFPGLWDLTLAGHVNAGEDSVETAVRELKEELGIKIKENNLRFITSFRNHHEYDNSKGHFIENQYYDLFILKKDVDIKNVKFNDGEVSQVKYINVKELLSLAKKGKMHPRLEWVNEIIRHINKK